MQVGEKEAEKCNNDRPSRVKSEQQAPERRERERSRLLDAPSKSPLLNYPHLSQWQRLPSLLASSFSPPPLAISLARAPLPRRLRARRAYPLPISALYTYIYICTSGTREKAVALASVPLPATRQPYPSPVARRTCPAVFARICGARGRVAAARVNCSPALT